MARIWSQEALACDIPIDLAAVSDRQVADEHSPLGPLALEVRRRGGTVVRVSEPVLAAISPVQHPSGVVAIARARPADVGVVFSTFTDLPLVFVLAGLQDPGNVGAIVRAVAAFGAIGHRRDRRVCQSLWMEGAARRHGGHFRLPIASRATLAEVTAAAALRGVRLVAAVPRGGTPLPMLDLRGPVAIILGGEGAGVSDATMAAAETTVTIPMQPDGRVAERRDRRGADSLRSDAAA